jgi:hypothetical protein
MYVSNPMQYNHLIFYGTLFCNMVIRTIDFFVCFCSSLMKERIQKKKMMTLITILESSVSPKVE